MNDVIKSPKELQQDLGVALRNLRINRGLKQVEVAAKAGIALRSLANMERGAGSTIETLVRTLNALGAADVIAKLAPPPQVSPLAMLRKESRLPLRVRRRNATA